MFHPMIQHPFLDDTLAAGNNDSAEYDFHGMKGVYIMAYGETQNYTVQVQCSPFTSKEAAENASSVEWFDHGSTHDVLKAATLITQECWGERIRLRLVGENADAVDVHIHAWPPFGLA
jgi:hypothetical protein